MFIFGAKIQTKQSIKEAVTFWILSTVGFAVNFWCKNSDIQMYFTKRVGDTIVNFVHCGMGPFVWIGSRYVMVT